MRIVQQGAMGRDVAAAENFAEHGHEVYVIAQHRNPSLVDITEQTGGLYFCIKDICDVEQAANCVDMANPDMFYTNHDDSLAAGVVDAVRQRSKGSDRKLPLLIPGPNRETARIEWDKFYLRDMLRDVGPKYNPDYRKVTCEEELEAAIRYFEQREVDVAVKPRNLTGGKGVKVMGPHLEGYDQVKEYGYRVLQGSRQQGLLLEQAMRGREFTIMSYADGNKLAFAPATYDYPQRRDGDEGPGTGGMGSFTMPASKQLPFITEADYYEAVNIMMLVQDRLRSKGNVFNGTLYGSFFMTEEGLKVTEFNARAGDPEMINVINLLKNGVDLGEVLADVARGELEPGCVQFKPLASTVLYLVSPDYAYDRNEKKYNFKLDATAIGRHNCRHYFGAAERDDSKGGYRTVGSSRTLALAALGEMPWDARARIDKAIEEGVEGELEYRDDVASKEYIKGLAS